VSLAGASIVFRADAGLSIGNGHVMRCLTLADALAAWGAHCIFVCRCDPGHLNDRVRQRGFEVIELPTGVSAIQDAKLTAAALARVGADWLVVDHYDLDIEWERAAITHDLLLMVIDDLADRRHLCHLLLDQNLGRQREDYGQHVPVNCGLLIGPQYALVRPAFAERRRASLRRRESGIGRHLLVALGGVDHGNVTGAVLRALMACPLPPDGRVTVVLGPHSPWIDDVRVASERFPLRCELRVDVAEMSLLMAEADLAIGAAGSSAWERCTLGLPTLLLLLAENQRAGSKALDASNAGRFLESPADLFRAVPEMTLPFKLRVMSRAAAEVTDGAGAQRVVEQMAAAQS
jgi:UDP-2,4-diacetamido-2,4,6-trideoxy-beta-L-altropyranose hydrolase